MTKHPLSPVFEFIGHDYVSHLPRIDKVTTIKGGGIFETAVNTEPVEKYKTEEAALEGHQKWVSLVRRGWRND